MKTRHLLLSALFALLATTACGGSDDDSPKQPTPETPQEQKDTTQNDQQPADTTVTPTPDPEPDIAPLFVGGDMSLLTKYEAQGAQYKDKDGKAIGNLLTFVREQGWTGVRVRLMVDPTKSDDQKQVVQDLAYVKALGRRVKDAGLQLMLDFHYSDTWADPGKQWTPAAWASLNDTQLQQQIYDYTRDCLQQLADAGATPDLIQTGNEISYGMLWGTEAAVGNNQTNRCYTNSPQQNWDRFFALLRQAIKACREVCPYAKIIIHSERTSKPAVLTDFFDRIKAAQIDYDVIGLSYYPYFHGPLNTLEEALKQIWSKHYGKHVLIVETGYPWKWEVQGTEYDYTGTYPYTNAGQKAFTSALITMLLRHSEVCGLAWWYAEANAKGTTGDLAQGWYNAGLFDQETGRALDALYELKNFK
ncbi:MAG: glycosyl hydrolase 53 family protein [Prevotella sp.]|nr:glycosyl hydrolase 53 family protein [Prevotella sp.]